MTIVNKIDASFFFFHACHRAWNFTEQQRNSDPIRTHSNVLHCLQQAQALLLLFESKNPRIWLHLWMHAVVLKRIWLLYNQPLYELKGKTSEHGYGQTSNYNPIGHSQKTQSTAYVTKQRLILKGRNSANTVHTITIYKLKLTRF